VNRKAKEVGRKERKGKKGRKGIDEGRRCMFWCKFNVTEVTLCDD